MPKPMEARKTKLEKIQDKIKSLGLTPDSVSEAVEWARSKGATSSSTYKPSKICPTK